MKALSASVAFLSLLLLFGCLTAQQKPQAEITLAQKLGISPSSSYSARYLANITSDGETLQGTLSLYYMGNFTRMDFYFPKLPAYSAYVLDGTQYICAGFQNGTSCRRQAYSSQVGSFAPALLQPASRFEAQPLPPRTIGGIEGKCFLLSPLTASAPITSPTLACYTQDGIPLYLLTYQQKGGSSSEASLSSIGKPPQASDFTLPFAVEDALLQ